MSRRPKRWHVTVTRRRTDIRHVDRRRLVEEMGAAIGVYDHVERRWPLQADIDRPKIAVNRFLKRGKSSRGERADLLEGRDDGHPEPGQLKADIGPRGQGDMGKFGNV